jgi:hypothetical protein
MDNESVIEYVQRTRDKMKPDMELVVAVFDEIFGRDPEILQVDRGPVTWSWADRSNIKYGFEKWYVLTQSAMAGTEGYPMVTIRQSVAPRLDAWLTFSQLVIGPDERSIESSLAMAVANHIGGFDGVRAQVAELVVSLGGIPTNPADIVLPSEDGNGDKGGLN